MDFVNNGFREVLDISLGMMTIKTWGNIKPTPWNVNYMQFISSN
jgi:hypothetical protein